MRRQQAHRTLGFTKADSDTRSQERDQLEHVLQRNKETTDTTNSGRPVVFQTIRK